MYIPLGISRANAHKTQQHHTFGISLAFVAKQDYASFRRLTNG